MDSDFFTLVVIPILIFFARIFDVSIGTLRIIFISKGYKMLAPVIGFFEVLIWILAITRVMENLDNWVCYVAYAAGFASGNYIGMILEERLALGYQMIRVFTKAESASLTTAIRQKGYTATVVDGQGSEGHIGILFVIINRKRIDTIIDLIKFYNPNALYTIEDVRFVNKNIEPWVHDEV